MKGQMGGTETRDLMEEQNKQIRYKGMMARQNKGKNGWTRGLSTVHGQMEQIYIFLCQCKFPWMHGNGGMGPGPIPRSYLNLHP
jgi:hypothetical protein